MSETREEAQRRYKRARRADPAKYEHDLRVSREAKRRRRGRCVDCGAETRYAGGSNAAGSAVSLRCPACASIRNGERARGQGWSQRRLHELLAAGRVWTVDELLEQGVASSRPSLSVLLTREVQAGRVVRVGRGRYRLAERGREV